MKRETWLADAVEVTVSGLFTTHHQLRTATGILGELTLPAFKRKGSFQAADGRALTMERTNWWRGTYNLREGRVVLGTALTQGFLQRTISVGYGGVTHALEPLGLGSHGWHLIDEAGTALLEIRRRGIFRRGATLRVLQPVDVELLAFSYYLVNARWNEQTAAAGAAAGS